MACSESCSTEVLGQRAGPPAQVVGTSSLPTLVHLYGPGLAWPRKIWLSVPTAPFKWSAQGYNRGRTGTSDLPGSPLPSETTSLVALRNISIPVDGMRLLATKTFYCLWYGL